MTKQLEVHPFAEIVPPLQEWEEESLAESLSKHGQKDPITIYQGKILDGRHRDKLCKTIGVEPWYKPFVGTEEEALALVQARMRTRNSTASQRAMVAAKAANLLVGRPAKNTATAGISQEQAAATQGVSIDSVQRASRILKDGTPAVVDAVVNGKASVRDAASVVDEPAKVQNAAVDSKLNGHAKTLKHGAEQAKANGKPTPKKPTAPKPGKPVFDDRPFDKLFGALMRFFDNRKLAHGGTAKTKVPEHEDCVNKMGLVLAAWNRWQKKTT